jgi:ribosomal protein S18 acetylase RimI-like enzyme
MTVELDLGTAANDSLINGFLTLNDHVPAGVARDFGTVCVVSMGVPTPTFNRMFVFDSPSPTDLQDAIEWIEQRDVPYWITGTDRLADEIDERTTGLDLESSDDPQSAMAFPLDEQPEVDDYPGEIEIVTDQSGVDDFVAVADEVFHFSRETLQTVASPSAMGDERIEIVVGWIDGKPVACGIAVVPDEVASLYLIGVHESFRRQGLGDAITTAALRAAYEMGAKMTILQATETGEHLYSEMGFETVTQYIHHRPEQ